MILSLKCISAVLYSFTLPHLLYILGIWYYFHAIILFHIVSDVIYFHVVVYLKH